MASERRHDDADSDRLPAGLPSPLPPGWVFHPRSPTASVEELLKHAGVFHHLRHVGPIKVASIFDEDADRDTQDLLFQPMAESLMPATERSFLDPLPALIYLDTDFFVSLFFDNQPHHQRSQGFIERLVREGNTALVISSLLWTEFAYTLSRENFRLKLEGPLAREIAPERWVLPRVREAYLQRYIGAFDRVLTQFSWVEVPLDATIRRAAVDLMARHALGSQDAVHLASAFAANARDFVSFDASYRRVDGLALWNDGLRLRGGGA